MNAHWYCDRRGLRSGAIVGLVSLLCALPDPAAATSGKHDALDSGELGMSVAHLRDRVDALAGSSDLLDSLHFGWFDRPYARATLAVLVKTTSVLEREVRLRRRGNGAIADVSVRQMLSWAEDALSRVVHSDSHATFRPHRQRVTGASLTGMSATPALFAFVDRSTSTRRDTSFGDLDVLASLGFRVYARLDRDLGRREAVTVCADRANALGMAAVVVRTSPSSESESALAQADAAVTGANAVKIKPVTLRGLLQRNPARNGKAREATAIVDPPFGESWASSLARRALARGVSTSARYVSDGWSLPTIGNGVRNHAKATTAAMWVNAISGQSLGLFRGWRDLRDGSGSLHSSVASDPVLTEEIAHTALDLLRLGDVVTLLRSRPVLAVAVGLDAIDAKDENRWAEWTLPFWSALLERQIPFDVVSVASTSSSQNARYQQIFSLERDEASDLTRLLVSLERRMARESVDDRRMTARELDGQLARGLFVRDRRNQNGKSAVAVINLSNHPRKVRLAGRTETGRSRDIISGERIDHPDKSISLSPWQVRILRPE